MREVTGMYLLKALGWSVFWIAVGALIVWRRFS